MDEVPGLHGHGGELTACASLAPDRDMKESDRDKGDIGYAGIKIGAVRCPCVIVLEDSNKALYKVNVKKLPQPPPTHPINEEGEPPTANDNGGSRSPATTSSTWRASTRKRASSGAGISSPTGCSTRRCSDRCITSTRAPRSCSSRASGSNRETSKGRCRAIGSR